MNAQGLDHADDPGPAGAGLAVRQVVELRPEPLDREPHGLRRRDSGNAADQMSTPIPTATPPHEPLWWHSITNGHFVRMGRPGSGYGPGGILRCDGRRPALKGD